MYDLVSLFHIIYSVLVCFGGSFCSSSMIYSSCIWHHTSYPSQLCSSGVMILCTCTDALMLFSWSSGCNWQFDCCGVLRCPYWPLALALCLVCVDFQFLRLRRFKGDGSEPVTFYFPLLCWGAQQYGCLEDVEDQLITLIQTTGFVWHNGDILSLAGFLVSLYEELLPLV